MFTISYHKSTAHNGKEKKLNVILKSSEDLGTLNGVLEALILNVKRKRQNLTPDKLFLIEIWNRADDDGNGMLHETEIYDLLKSLNIHMPQKACKKLFAEFDTDNSKTLDFHEFTKFVEKLKER